MVEVKQEVGVCRICRRPLRNPKSVLDGIGPDCRRRVARAYEEDPSRPFGRFDWGSMDVELVRGAGGEWLHNLPKVEGWPGDGNPRGEVQWGDGADDPVRTLSFSILRLHGPILAPDDPRVARFEAEFLRTMPPGGGVVRGSDVLAFLLENPR